MLSDYNRQIKNNGDPPKPKPKWREDLWKYLLTTLLIPGVIYAGIIFFTIKPTIDALQKTNNDLINEQNTTAQTLGRIEGENKKAEELQGELNENLNLQLDLLDSENLKTAYFSLAGIYNQKLNQLNSDSPQSEFELLNDLRLELISLAEQIAEEKEKTSATLFNEKTRDSVRNLYSSIFQADLTRFLEGLIWKVYGRLGPTESIFMIEVSPIEKAFIEASGKNDTWFRQTVNGITTSQVEEVKNVFSKLGILHEEANDLALDTVLSNYNNSLKASFPPEITEMTFLDLAGQPRLQFGIYLALYDSGLLDLEKALFFLGNVASNEDTIILQKQIFEDNLNLISPKELKDLAELISAKLIDDLDSKVLAELFEERTNSLENSFLSEDGIETVYNAETVEKFFVEALRWAVKSSTAENFCDRLRAFLGSYDQQCKNPLSSNSNVSDNQSSTYIQTLLEFETLYKIAEAKAFSTSFQQPETEQ